MKASNIKNIYKKINNILANLSAMDFWNANKNSTRARKGRWTKAGSERKWRPYTLSPETEEAMRMLSKIKLDMTRDDEAVVKGFIMRYFILEPEFESNPNFYLNKVMNENHE
jgi:hypothetical protein